MGEQEIYFNIWDSENQQSINLKCFFELTQETQTENETEQTEKNDFFVYCDGNIQNRNLIIVDRLGEENNNKREFKAKSYLSKQEKALLKKIKP